MLARERAALVDARGEDRVGEGLRALVVALDRGVVEDERMEVAVAGVEDVADPQPVLLGELVDPPQDGRELRPRHDAVLDVVVGRHAPHRGERALAPEPEEQRARRASLAVRISNAPAARQSASTAAVSSSTCAATPSSSTRRTDPAPSGYPGRYASSAAWIVKRSMISIAAGRIPAATIRETASPAASTDEKAASCVTTTSGCVTIRSVTSTAMPSVPSEPTITPSRSGPSSASIALPPSGRAARRRAARHRAR